MYVFICVHVCVPMHTVVYIHIYMYLLICVYTYVLICIHGYVFRCVYILTSTICHLPVIMRIKEHVCVFSYIYVLAPISCHLFTIRLSKSLCNKQLASSLWTLVWYLPSSCSKEAIWTHVMSANLEEKIPHKLIETFLIGPGAQWFS